MPTPIPLPEQKPRPVTPLPQVQRNPGAPIVGSPNPTRTPPIYQNPANPANRNNLAGAKRGMRAEAMKAAALRRAKQYQQKTNLRNTAGNLGKQIPEQGR